MAEARGRLPDVFFTQDYPVLLEVARWQFEGRPGRISRPEDIAKRLGRDPDQVTESVGRLWHAGYLEAKLLQAMGMPETFFVDRLTPRGLEEVGAYPKPTDLADRLHHLLEAEAAQAERTDPQQAGKIRQAARTLVDIGTTFAAKFAAEMAKPG